MNLNLTIQHNDLLPVYKTGKGNQAVILRDVHAKLAVAKKFTTWAKAKIKEHRLVENTDFVISDLQVTNSRPGRRPIEYVVPLNIAKKVAMGVNTEAGDRVKDYFIRCEEIAVAVVSGQPAPRRFSDFAQPAVQVQCVKEIGHALYKPNNDPADIIGHHRQVSLLLTGLRPSAYVHSFVLRGLRVASFSARALMRKVEPEKACTAAFIDDARLRGKSLEQLSEAGVISALPQAFRALMNAGYSLCEVEALAG